MYACIHACAFQTVVPTSQLPIYKNLFWLSAVNVCKIVQLPLCVTRAHVSLRVCVCVCVRACVCVCARVCVLE